MLPGSGPWSLFGNSVPLVLRCRIVVQLLADATLLHTRVFKDVRWSYHWHNVCGSVLELITKDLRKRNGQTAP